MSIPSAEPWRALPGAVADVIEPELPAMTTDILATIAREVPEYARPLEGSFGRGLKTGVTEALRQFVALIRDPDAGREQGREVYRGLGRGEFREGRTLDSLQAAYRVGARVAWRREASAGRRAGLDSEVLSVLAESIFAYIDELSADSVEGYAEAQSQVEGERQRRRSDLLTLLVREPPAEEADVRVAAQAAGWTLPRSAAALAYAESELRRVARRLPSDALVASRDATSCALIPDPGGPGRAEQIERAVDGLPAALGPAGGWPELTDSWSLARAALRGLEAGALGAEGFLRVEEHLADLMLFRSRALLERVAERRLAAFGGLTAKARARMEQTALAYVRNQGNAAAMARALHVHPQTARHRLARLRELLGDDLGDPDARFELEAALRYPFSPER
jgi:hypothetical protein